MCKFLSVALILLISVSYVYNCLITNCPRGGKRGGKLNLIEGNIKQCISCGPGRLGQCFGPSICCGPFGCLLGTPETMRCQRDGLFHEREPCIAGNSACRKNTGRCAAEGLCCTQESCHADKACTFEDKPNRNMEMDSIYGLINSYQQNPPEYMIDSAV